MYTTPQYSCASQLAQSLTTLCVSDTSDDVISPECTLRFLAHSYRTAATLLKGIRQEKHLKEFEGNVFKMML